MKLPNLLRADSTLSLPTVGNDYVDAVIGFFQQYLDFSTGAMAIVIAAVGLLAAAAFWYLSPKEGVVGVALKSVGAAILILNIPLIVESFRL